MSKPRKKRPAAKEQALTDKLRRAIVSGLHAPGMRLPVRRDLQRRFNVSSVTVQRAMDMLMADGFIRADGRAGSFVADRPPHLARFGVAFPHTALTRFWTALKEQAELLGPELGYEIVFYRDIAGHVDTDDYRRLAADVRAARLAGLLYVTPFQVIAHGRCFPRAAIPLVVLTEDASVPGAAAVCLDDSSWQKKALDDLQARGRRRIAFLTIPGVTPKRDTSRVPMEESLKARGMVTKPAWCQATEAPYADWASNAVQAMLQLPRGERPDGLIITDDHLVEAGTRGIKALGLRVPDDLAVVAHCNYPALPNAEVPVRWLGFDARETVVTAMRLAREIRTGIMPGRVLVPALFEEEWKVERGRAPSVPVRGGRPGTVRGAAPTGMRREETPAQM